MPIPDERLPEGDEMIDEDTMESAAQQPIGESEED